ncbi:hypothetical protein [Streptomyces sp. NPDC008137]|uniref:hypothetical protein n=1 Tax=Streptomyces sp. NPDC008137 TaxID=3364813 RepID=UPI0036ECA731
MTDAMFDWRPFLVRWSEEWGDALRPDDSRGEPDEEARRAGWLGFAPAPNARIAALEERLGLRLPLQEELDEDSTPEDGEERYALATLAWTRPPKPGDVCPFATVTPAGRTGEDTMGS